MTSDVAAQFLIYVIGSSDVERVTIKGILEGGHYSVLDFSSFEDALLEIRTKTPHLILTTDIHSVMGLLQFIEITKIISADITIIPMLSPIDRELGKRCLDKGVYEIFWTYSLEFEDLRARIDHCLEGMYQKFKIEQLGLRIKELESQSTSLSQGLAHDKFFKNLFKFLLDPINKCSTQSEFHSKLVNGLSSFFENENVAFLRYIPAYKALSLSAYSMNSRDFTSNIGVDFESLSMEDIQKIISKETEHAPLEKLLKFLFTKEEVFWLPILLKETELVGIIAISLDKSRHLERRQFESIISIVVNCFVHWEIKAFVANGYDRSLIANCFTDKFIYSVIKSEIKRAHRLKLSFSLLRLEYANFKSLKVNLGEQGSAYVLKLISNYIKKTSRDSDSVGYLNNGHFLLLLPDTDRAGAALKKRRLKDGLMNYLEMNQVRKMIKGAIRFNVGAATFPGDGTASDELVFSATLDCDKADMDGKMPPLTSLHVESIGQDLGFIDK